MRPDYHKAIIDTIRYYGWKKIMYLYDSHDGEYTNIYLYMYIYKVYECFFLHWHFSYLHFIHLACAIAIRFSQNWRNGWGEGMIQNEHTYKERIFHLIPYSKPSNFIANHHQKKKEKFHPMYVRTNKNVTVNKSNGIMIWPKNQQPQSNKRNALEHLKLTI